MEQKPTGVSSRNKHQDLMAAPSVGDLVAIGAISLLDSPQSMADSARFNPRSRAASLTTELTTNSQPRNKLDYIIDFMRANKLTKFCDLITSQEMPVRQLNKQLNELPEFTLFVPTNEALLLMASGQLEQVKRQPEVLRRFIGAHATNELVVPRTGMSSLQPASLSSLSGGQLRIVTLAPPVALWSGSGSNGTGTGTGTGTGAKLEMVVNGATVLSGNSYALQEPNNNKVTYAIVHLIDRVLYPMADGRLIDKVRQLAPKMATFFQLASSDAELREALASSNGANDNLWTLFLPSDDSFETMPAKLIHQLESNRTFLLEFLRGHLIDGLYFSSQLSALANQQRPPNKLVSLSGKLLEIEAKMVQARTLVLVNSTPLLEPDIMALNGVVHLVSRPILERQLADDCNCASSASLAADFRPGNSNDGLAWPPEGLASNRLALPRPDVVTYEFDNRAAASGAGNWARRPAKQQESSIQYAPTAGEANSLAELEREESRIVGARDQRSRSQRSDTHLVERNNRDFYRPSTAPANLLAEERPAVQEVDRLPIGTGRLLEGAAVRKELIDGIDMYKVVLNATSRERLRETLRNDTQSQGLDLAARFAYDRPMIIGSSTPASELGGQSQAATPSSFILRRPYTPTAQPMLAKNSTSHLQDQLASSSISHSSQQQLIKFQPEDARDSAESSFVLPSASGFLRNSRLQAAAPSDRVFAAKREQPTGKTMAPQTDTGKSSAGCAFYDTECRRLSGKLVRLPPIRNRLVLQQKSSSMQASSSNRTLTRTSSPVRSSAAEPQLNLDSTFGETETSSSLHSNGTHEIHSSGAQQNRFALGAIRGSPLNQPLPPWSSDEELANQRANRWTGPAASGLDGTGSDLARLKGPAYGFAAGISRGPAAKSGQQQSSLDSRPPRAEILLLPVKILQEPSSVAGNASSQLQKSNFIERPQLSPFSANRQFHTPTPYSVSIMTTHMPPIFVASHSGSQPLGRLTNFTAFEYVPEEAPLSAPANSKQIRFESAGQSTVNRLPLQTPLRSPSNFRKQRLQQPQQTSLDSPKQIGSRKAVLFQQQVEPQGDEFGSPAGGSADVSITSARLTNLLATQASNVSANFVRSVTTPSSAPLGPPSDFFQDRSIADIMDDSGLRIDGQQVTFARLKECLEEAKLLSLVSQTDNSLTVFMPTDLAFQRLIQQQALLHQQRQRDSRQSSSFSSTGDRLLPLMARGSRPTGAMQPLLAADSSEHLDGSLASIGDRLTLDCGSQQVRKLLLDHLSARLIQPKQLTLDTSVTSLNGHKLLLSSVPSKKIVVVDGQPVVAATRAKNGMVYVVNKFLNLTAQMPNVVELMESQPNLTTFLSYLNFSSISERLKRESGPLTILAPTNEAFEQLTPAARQLINSDPAALTDILRGHIVEGAQFGKLIPMRNKLRTMNADQWIEAKVIKPNVYLLDNQMTSMRLVGTTGNGVVNAIDRLIVPAWLRVSMGSTRSGASGSSAAELQPTGSLADSPPGTRLRPHLANLNLPSISNQPLRFEQPTNRLSAPSGRDSFLLDSSSVTTNDNTNNLLTDFDLPSPGSDHTTRSQSPFARLPNEIHEQSGFLSPSRLMNATTASNNKNVQLIEKLAQLMMAKKFVKYLLRSGVSEKLKPDMNYVILVPTDQAIEKLPKQIIDLLERDRERLADLINYHVLDTTFEYINTIPDGQTLNTLNEKDILFNWHRNNTILTASGAVVMGGIQEDNIALLIVDRVLYPTPGDILNIISKSPILSNFTSLVRNAGLERQLSLAGPFTLFAPSDFAFNQLTRSDMDLLRRNKDTARRFLLRHLSQPAVFTSSIALSNSTSAPASVANSTTINGNIIGRQLVANNVPQMTISNSLGEELTLRQRNDYFSVNEVNFSYADVAATNGVVHVIDGLL